MVPTQILVGCRESGSIMHYLQVKK
jgi:hypothetical protein